MSRNKLILRLFVGILLVSGAIFSFLGNTMNDNQLLGCLLTWAFLTVWAVFMFWAGSWPLIYRLGTDTHARRLFSLGVAGLAFAILQIPLWSLMTQRFPPDNFTLVQAILASCGAVISLIAPAAPTVIRIMKGIWLINQEQRRRLKL